MKEESLVPDSFYEERRITPKRRQDSLPSAGIYLLDGAWRVEAYGTPGQQALVDAGALLVASLVFDGSHAERPVRGDVLLSLYPADELPPHGKRRAAETLGFPPIGN